MVMRKITMAVTWTAVPKDKQQGVIWFFRLENVLDSEIHMRMYVRYHKINCEPMGTEIQGGANKDT